MRRLPIRCLLCSCLALAACASNYKALTAAATDTACRERVRPAGIRTSWYTTTVDVVGRHISGLLLIKEMPDKSVRVVFTNEAGLTFFDFEFTADGVFKPRQVISALNKKPVIKTLQKDFALLLGFPFRGRDPLSWRMDEAVYYGVANGSERAYYITDSTCARLRGMERGSARKRVATIRLEGADATLPDAVEVKHHTFDMIIRLKKMERP